MLVAEDSLHWRKISCCCTPLIHEDKQLLTDLQTEWAFGLVIMRMEVITLKSHLGILDVIFLMLFLWTLKTETLGKVTDFWDVFGSGLYSLYRVLI